MNLELTGKLVESLAEVTGKGRNGDWVKQEFIVETTDDQYPKKVCFSLWGDRTQALKTIQPGSLIKVKFNIESREYNSRWYTDARAWRVEMLDGSSDSAPPQQEASAAPAPASTEVSDGKDDLPF